MIRDYASESASLAYSFVSQFPHSRPALADVKHVDQVQRLLGRQQSIQRIGWISYALVKLLAMRGDNIGAVHSPKLSLTATAISCSDPR